MSMWDDEAGYDRDDPKHPDWADAMADRADMQRKREKEQRDEDLYVLGKCPHGVDLDRDFCPKGCRVNRDELLALASRHSQEVWGEQTAEIGEGHLILERHGIDAEDATALGLGIVMTANGTDTTPGLISIFLQGLIFGLWLADQERT